MRITALILAAILGGGSMGFAENHTVDFTGDAAGQPPKGFSFGHTAKVGAPAPSWASLGLPKAGDVIDGGRLLDDASRWSFSIVFVLPIAPL